MSADQAAITTIMIGALVLFVWSRWRFDIVALLALFASVIFGLLEPEAAFEGFAHPAVITVAAVLIVSRGIAVSGLVDRLAAALARMGGGPQFRIAALCGVAAVISGFMNNVGALALLLPVALATAEKGNFTPARILMPLSFSAILGGLTTLIGTPPNLIVAEFRARTEEPAFSLFEFMPVGAVIALLGTGFVVLFAGRLVPARGGASDTHRPKIAEYLAEVRVPPSADLIGHTANEISHRIGQPLRVAGLVRGGVAQRGVAAELPLQAEDTLLVRGNIAALRDIMAEAGLEIASGEVLRKRLLEGGLSVAEAVVPPRSRLDGRSAAEFRLKERFGLDLIGVAREGRFLRERLRELVFQPGDVLLLHGDAETLSEKVSALEALPLAGSEPVLMPRRAWLPALIFALAIAAIVAGLAPPAFALSVAALAMVLSGALTLHMAYDALDLPVLVLLAAMLPVGGALETTGTTGLIADAILYVAGDAPLALLLLFVMIVTMTLSDLMNNAATAVVMAPIALGLAERMNVDPDPLLMGVAVSASCAFLTPIGHQNNALVMGPGGYRFGDYWRLGLPLEVLILAVATFLIPLVWSW